MDEEYANEITRHAVLRTCMALGLKATKEECLDVVGDVVRHFIQTLAIRARDSAETSDRAVGGIQDIFPTLESMGPFDVSWKTLRDFGLEVEDNTTGNTKWDQPFPFEVPVFPINKPSNFIDDGPGREKIKYDGDSFVPSHLPAYPSSHTYQSQLGKKRRLEEQQTSQQEDMVQNKKLKPVLNTKHARESLMKLENLPTIGDPSTSI